MGLFRTSILNGIAVLIKMATMFVLNKILAVYVGPSGYAAIGQFQNFIQVTTLFTGTSVNNGVIKYTAENLDNCEEQQKIWQSSAKFVVLASIFVSVLIFFLRHKLSLWLFKGDDHQYVFIWFSVFLIFFNINALLLAILNGMQKITRLVTTNIVGSLVSFAVTSLMAIFYSLSGALIAISIYQSINCFVTFAFCRKIHWLPSSIFLKQGDYVIIKKLLPFAAMAFTTIICGNFAQFALRDMIIVQFDIKFAGYWDAMNRLSGAYLMLATTILSVYYLPKLSSLKKSSEVISEIKTGYKFILPIAIISSIAVYILREFIVLLLFTKDFMLMLDLMLWQLIGDVIKIGSWIISFMMISKAMTKEYIIIESIFLLSIIPLTYLGISYFGFTGITIAFTLNNLMYWIVCSYVSLNKLKVGTYG